VFPAGAAAEVRAGHDYPASFETPGKIRIDPFHGVRADIFMVREFEVAAGVYLVRIDIVPEAVNLAFECFHPASP
jgi:hypothetical protein